MGNCVGEAVDRGRGRGDDLPHPRRRRRLDDVVGAVDQDFKGEPRLRRALRDPDGGEVEDQVGAAHQLGDKRAIPDVALDEPHRLDGRALASGSPTAADEIVQDDDLARPRRDELVNDRGADRARPAGDQAPAVP